MASRRASRIRSCDEGGQATLLMLGVMAALLLGTSVLWAFGQALGAKGRHQRAADLAAMSAARAMRDAYPRLFEAALLENGAPNPRHLSRSEYELLARDAALRAGRRNGVSLRAADVRFPAGSFAPTRVTVVTRGAERMRLPGTGRRARAAAIAVRGRATAELSPAAATELDLPTHGGGGYDGPLAYRQGKPSPYLFSAL